MEALAAFLKNQEEVETATDINDNKKLGVAQEMLDDLLQNKSSSYEIHWCTYKVTSSWSKLTPNFEKGRDVWDLIPPEDDGLGILQPPLLNVTENNHPPTLEAQAQSSAAGEIPIEKDFLLRRSHSLPINESDFDTGIIDTTTSTKVFSNSNKLHSSSFAEPIPIHSYNHDSHSSSSLIKTKQFYEDVLGFQSTNRPSLSVDGFWVVHLVAGYQFHLIGHPPSNERRSLDDGWSFYDDHVAFYVEDLIKCHELLKLHGVDTCTIDVDMNAVPCDRPQMIYFQDPDRNNIFLYESPKITIGLYIINNQAVHEKIVNVSITQHSDWQALEETVIEAFKLPPGSKVLHFIHEKEQTKGNPLNSCSLLWAEIRGNSHISQTNSLNFAVGIDSSVSMAASSNPSHDSNLDLKIEEARPAKHPAAIKLLSLKYRAFSCTNFSKALQFYCHVLGFRPVANAKLYFLNLAIVDLVHPDIGFDLRLIPGCQKPSAKNHLNHRSDEIRTTNDHISFYCKDMKLVKTYLEDRKIRHLESNLPVINVAQLFMHDPDNHMIEFCACEDVTDEFYKPVKSYRDRHKDNEASRALDITTSTTLLTRTSTV